MSNEKLKNKPQHIPDENVYMGTHWAIYLSYLIALVSLFLLINESMFG